MKKAFLVIIMFVILLCSACSNVQIHPEPQPEPQIQTPLPNGTEAVEEPPEDKSTEEPIDEIPEIPDTEQVETVQQLEDNVEPVEVPEPSPEVEQVFEQETEPKEPPVTKPSEREQQIEPKPTDQITPDLPEKSESEQPPDPKPEPESEENIVFETIDPAAVAAYGHSYAQSLGFVIDTSMNEGNASYYPPLDFCVTSMEEAYAAAAQMVARTKAFIQGYGYDPTGFRYHCRVEVIGSDEYGTYIMITDFYG